MGDASAEASIREVIEAHGEELATDAISELHMFFTALGVELDTSRIEPYFAIDATQLDVHLAVKDPDGAEGVAPGTLVGIAVHRYDIMQLEERFPDCDIAY